MPNGTSLKKQEYWGLRGLAYRIKKNRKGHYMLLGIDSKPAAITEMERQLGLNEDVLRFMTIRLEAIDEAPSAILSRKSDERERGFRGPKPAGRLKAAASAGSTTARNSARVMKVRALAGASATAMAAASVPRLRSNRACPTM